jgi:hypothetical protein
VDVGAWEGMSDSKNYELGKGKKEQNNIISTLLTAGLVCILFILLIWGDNILSHFNSLNEGVYQNTQGYRLIYSANRDEAVISVWLTKLFVFMFLLSLLIMRILTHLENNVSEKVSESISGIRIKGYLYIISALIFFMLLLLNGCHFIELKTARSLLSNGEAKTTEGFITGLKNLYPKMRNSGKSSGEIGGESFKVNKVKFRYYPHRHDVGFRKIGVLGPRDYVRIAYKDREKYGLDNQILRLEVRD